jgi:TolB-like protein
MSPTTLPPLRLLWRGRPIAHRALREGMRHCMMTAASARHSLSRGRPRSYGGLYEPHCTPPAIGLASLPVFAGSWLLSSTAPPTPHASLALASTTADRLKTQVPSIAVLPFITRSEDAKLDYLADGITDSLISDLVRAMPGISVVSRGTAFTYKGRSVDARQVGRELGVRYLLKGSIVFEGERVRANTELAETTEGN